MTSVSDTSARMEETMSDYSERRLEDCEDLLIEIGDALCKLLNPQLPSTPEVYADGIVHAVEQLQRSREEDKKSRKHNGCQLCGRQDGNCIHVRAQQGD